LRCASEILRVSNGKHVDENNLDTVRIFNVEETGPSTIQSTQEVLQILG